MATNRYTFRALVTNVGVSAGGDHISKCNSLLPNRMQCDKAGAYWVEDAENPTKPPYQVCKAHALILESEGKDWVAPVSMGATGQATTEQIAAADKTKADPTAANAAKPVPAQPVAPVTSAPVKTVPQTTPVPPVDKK